MRHYIKEQLKESSTNHSLLLGIAESGKTHAIKLEIDRYLNKGKKVFLLDFNQQYEEFLDRKSINKLVIKSSEDICLFEFIPNINFSSEESTMYRFEYNLFCIDRMNALLNLYQRPLTHGERRTLLDALEQLFKRIGITQEHYMQQEEFPNLDDFLTLLEKESVALYQEIAHFKNYFTARKSIITFTDALDYLIFDDEHLVKGEKELLYHTLFLILKQQIRNQSNNSVFVIDGLELFAISEHIAEDLIMMLKSTAKKYGTICLFTHPSLAKLLKQCGEGILANSHTFVLLKQSENERNVLKEYFDFYEEQISDLMSLPKGQALAIHSSIVAKLYFPRKLINQKNTHIDAHSEQD